MKKIIYTLLASLFLINTFSCSSKNTQKTELVIFAAASMTETLNEIKTLYENENKNVNIIYNFDSSGTLKTQIENGAICDVFISAAPKQMNALHELNLIDESTRINLLENKVSLVVTDDNKKNILSYEDLFAKLPEGNIILAIGNSDVPVGQYTEKIFKYFNMDENKLNSINALTYGTNVKEVTTQVKENVVDAGIIYATDAVSANLHIVDTATKDMCGEVLYPIAVLKESKNIVEAKKFIEYLKNDKSKNIFKNVGFTPLS